MKETLNELLRPPFEVVMVYGSYRILMGEHNFVFHASEKVSRTKQKIIAKWTAEAMNEKYERDFGEPMRWKEVAFTDDWKCPECEQEFYLNGHSPDKLSYNYCPNCRQRLLPPEGSE